MDKKILKELSELNNRLAEDRMYEIAVDEIENNDFDKVAQAIAFEEAEGDEKKARAFYTKHRVRRIKDEITYFVTELAAHIEAEAKKEDQRIVNLKKQNQTARIEKRKDGVLSVINSCLRIIFFVGLTGVAVTLAISILLMFGVSSDTITPVLALPIMCASLYVAYKLVVKMFP